VLQAGKFRVIFLVRRIKGAAPFKLPRIGYDNLPERVMGIIPIDEGQVVVISPERERLTDLLHLSLLFSRKPDKVVELVDGMDVLRMHGSPPWGGIRPVSQTDSWSIPLFRRYSGSLKNQDKPLAFLIFLMF